MKRSEIRESAMICIYQCLLLKSDVNSIIKGSEEFSQLNDNLFFSSIVNNAFHNYSFLVERINSKLVDWEFDRLGFVEKAILLTATCELYSDDDDKAVIINEAVNMTKKYCDDISYKLINGVLDNIYE